MGAYSLQSVYGVSDCNVEGYTNQAIAIHTSAVVLAHGKISECRCSTPTASFEYAAVSQYSMAVIQYHKVKATRVNQLGVAALGKGGILSFSS
jgi:hypothetical protein